MTSTKKQQNLVVGLLTSPWSILVSVAVAVVIGLLFKNVATILKPFGQMYLYLIEMTVIPIIISAIVSSVAGLAKSTGMRGFLVRMIVIFVAMLVASAVIGTLGGVIGHPGSGLDAHTRDTLGSIVKSEQSQYATDLKISLSAPYVHKPKTGIIDFLIQIVPQNIFSALSSGRALALIFFAIIFGIAVGVLRGEQGDSLISLFDGLFKAFQKIIAWLMVALPIGLICLLADQVASTGVQILLAMLKFILIFYIVGTAVFIMDVVIIWRRSHMKLGAVLKAILDPIIVSLVTRSSFATLPTAIKSLEQKLGYYERSTNLFLSLGITLGRFGNIIYFAIAALFVAQLYGVNMDLSRYGIVVVGSLFAGMATAGASGIATLNLLGIVLGPLGLPLEAVLIIFITIDAIADPLRTMLIILTNMAANTLIVPRTDTLNRRKPTEVPAGRGSIERTTDLITEIRNRGELVAVAELRSLPPIYSQDGDNGDVGLAVECVSRIAAALGVKLKLNLRADSLSGLITYLKEGHADLLIGSGNFSAIYENELAYTKPYVTTRDAVLVSKVTLGSFRTAGEGGKASFRSFSGTLGVLAGSVQAMVTGRVFPAATVRFFEESNDMVDAVISGQIEASFSTELELRHWMSKRPLSNEKLSCVGFTNRPVDFRLAVTPDNRAALETLDSLIEGAAGNTGEGVLAETDVQ